MSAPRLAIREARAGRRAFDLLFYDDVLAVVPRAPEPGQWDAVPLAVAGLVSLLTRRRREERTAAREAERRLPRGTRLLPLDGVRAARVEARPYGAATLEIDGLRLEIPMATTYRDPWDRLLGPVFGDRLTVV